VVAVEVPEGPDPLLPVFKPGEELTIQRSVDGQNVLMFVQAVDPCSIGRNGLILKARMRKYGVSSYADGRVETQYRTITRLMEERDRILELAIQYGVPEIVDLITGEKKAEAPA
jgi:hypothetical protein